MARSGILVSSGSRDTRPFFKHLGQTWSHSVLARAERAQENEREKPLCEPPINLSRSTTIGSAIKPPLTPSLFTFGANGDVRLGEKMTGPWQRWDKSHKGRYYLLFLFAFRSGIPFVMALLRRDRLQSESSCPFEMERWDKTSESAENDRKVTFIAFKRKYLFSTAFCLSARSSLFLSFCSSFLLLPQRSII